MSHLAVLIPSLAGGGAEKVMINLARGLLQSGFSVDLIVATKSGPLENRIPPELNLIDLHAGRMATAIPGLIRYLSATRPDVLISAIDQANVAALIAGAISMGSTRIAVSVRTSLSHSSRHGTVRQRMILTVARVLYRRADWILAVSLGVARELTTFLGQDEGRIRVLDNPALEPELSEMCFEASGHPWLTTSAPPVLLGVGRMTPAKNFTTLIHAFAHVRAVQPARLIILGDGECRPELERLVARLDLGEDVDMPGFVTNPYAFMSRASVFVLSSDWEGFGNALVEAMACGARIVSTDCDYGPREILDHGRLGRLVSPGDSVALADAILLTLREPAKPDVSAVVERFTIQNAVSNYIRVLDLKA